MAGTGVTGGLAAAVRHHIDTLREELAGANLLDTLRMRNTAEVEIEGVLMLVQPTEETRAKAEAVVRAFDAFHAAAQRLGPLPTHSRIRKAHAAAGEALDDLERSLGGAKLSELATGLGLD